MRKIGRDSAVKMTTAHTRAAAQGGSVAAVRQVEEGGRAVEKHQLFLISYKVTRERRLFAIKKYGVPRTTECACAPVRDNGGCFGADCEN